MIICVFPVALCLAPQNSVQSLCVVSLRCLKPAKQVSSGPCSSGRCVPVSWFDRGRARPLVARPSQALAATDSHIHYVDCSAGLTNATGIDRGILEDALHPNAAGYENIFAALSPVVDRLMLSSRAPASPGACPSAAEAKAAGAALLAGSNATVSAQVCPRQQ